MKILYGVQATGQGHISRARAMAEALRDMDVEVQWLFSGRPRDALYDMEPFGDHLHRRGLTFRTRAGRLRYVETARTNSPLQFIRDIRALDLTPYDLIVTDFEPVTAWAARLAGRPVIGIGHQYAFGPNTPVRGDNVVSRFVMRHFAPVSRPLGLHWSRYAANVLPPILDLPEPGNEQGDHILVYLPFEDQAAVTALLQQLPHQRFRQYGTGLQPRIAGNVLCRRASIDGFKRDLASCRGVICNSGFELISECLHWQKPVLTKPLSGQMEQESNALALEQLGYASTLSMLDKDRVGQWLQQVPAAPRLQFANVAGRLARWLADGALTPLQSLSADLWPAPPRSDRSEQFFDRAG